jgi:GT2 family glycosyltransferase/precorrin-6B methylase 2/glycosyltransferase involved in cell wall biosynthesis
MKEFPKDFIKNDGIWVPIEGADNIPYSDGKTAEAYIRNCVEKASDISSTSAQLQAASRDWSSRYHFSPTRGNLFRALSLRPGIRILELGSGCGAITRPLGEQDTYVTAVEGSDERARITRLRCRDLDNVEVISGNFDDLSFKKRFDMVTLIGVLEYSHLFCRGENDPFSSVLKSAWNSLEDDGVIVIAIENKLGIKYMSGCSEDHLGKRFIGIEGYPDDEGAKTFGKAELIELVEGCGFMHHELLLPFPDYKLPTTLINAAACTAKDARRFNLSDWCRQPYEDYTQSREYLFDDHLALDSMAINGLMPDHANSFLLIASKQPLDKKSPITPINWHAKKLNVTRQYSYQTITTLEDSDEGSVVTKRGIHEVKNRGNSLFTLSMKEHSQYIEYGHSLAFEMLRVCRSNKKTQERFSSLVEEWSGYLKANTTLDQDMLPGEFLDCIPDNIIRDKDGCLNYIDTEWHWHEPISIERVLFRGLYVFWANYRRWMERRFLKESYSFAKFINISLEKTDISLSEHALKEAGELEGQFQSEVYGNNIDGYFSSLMSKVFNGSDEISNKSMDEYYKEWIAMHALQEIDGQLFAERMMTQWKVKPVFHLLMFLMPGEEALLADTLDSLAQQMHPEWRLTVIGEGLAPNDLWHDVEVLTWMAFNDGDNPYDLLNRAIDDTHADWVAFIQPGIRFEPQSLIQFGDYINLNSSYSLIYSDEDVINESSLRSDPKFKPDFNLDLLRSMPYIGDFCLVENEALKKVGGFQPYTNYENYDIALKIFEQFGENAIAHIPDVLFHMSSVSKRKVDHRILRDVVQHHFERSTIEAVASDGYLPGTVRAIYYHSSTPKVSIIIPSQDKLEFFQPCVESLIEKTQYPDYEIIIIDHQSQDPDALAYYNKLVDQYPNKVRLLQYEHDFNFSDMMNFAFKHAQGDYFLMLDNDTEILQSEWLSRMMDHAQRPDVGIVGARLVKPETGHIEHAGFILGLRDIAESPYKGVLDIKEPGYMGRTQVDQNYSAVSAACLLISRQAYEAVGGMNDVDFRCSFADVDLCLRVKQIGLRIVWTPYSTLVHHGGKLYGSNISLLEASASKLKQLNSEREKMLEKWLPELSSDPAYNPNLSLVHNDYRIEVSIPRNWDVNFHDRNRILGLPLVGGSGDYRVIYPLDALSKAGLAQTEYYRFGKQVLRKIGICEIERMQPDVFLVQAAINDVQLKQLEEINEYSQKVMKIFTLDDLVTNVPEKSSVYKDLMRSFRDARSRMRKALSYCDRLIVSTQFLADSFSDMINDIRVVPNRLDRDKWLHLRPLRNQGSKPRVGWVGAQQHQGDLEVLIDVVRETASEFDWVFMGMCPEEIRSCVKEFHEFVPIQQYPTAMAGLNLDIAVAPLEMHPFNEAKSNLRILEYGALAWPVVCTDIYPYRSYDAPVSRVMNETQAWIDAIREYASDPEAATLAGSTLREWVMKSFILQDHLPEYLDVFTRSEVADKICKVG